VDIKAAHAVLKSGTDLAVLASGIIGRGTTWPRDSMQISQGPVLGPVPFGDAK
jgi:hypothetical protein